MEWLRRLLQTLFDLIAPARFDAALLSRSSDDALLQKFSPRWSESVLVLSSYSDPHIKALIHELKYHDSPRASGLLAAALREALLGIVDEFSLSGSELVLVPIPLSQGRLKERGFNQIERVIGASLPGTPNATSKPVLRKVRETAPQTKLARHERLENLHAAFVCERIDANCHYIVVDDVLTTGATLFEAKRALREAGARDVTLVALAH